MHQLNLFTCKVHMQSSTYIHKSQTHQEYKLTVTYILNRNNYLCLVVSGLVLAYLLRGRLRRLVGGLVDFFRPAGGTPVPVEEPGPPAQQLGFENPNYEDADVEEEEDDNEPGDGGLPAGPEEEDEEDTISGMYIYKIGICIHV